MAEKPNVRTVIPEVVAVPDLLVAVERLPLRPGAVGRGDVGDRPPAGPPERGGERETLAGDQRRVAAGAVDPRSRLQRGVREPASSAERRRRDPTAAGREPVGLELPGAVIRRSGRWAARTTFPGPPSGRSSRRTRAGRPCRAIPSGAGRGHVAVRDPCGRSGPELSFAAEVGPHGLHLADCEVRGARSTRSRRPRPVRRTPSRAPRRRRARPPPAASVGGDGPRPGSAGRRPAPGRRARRDRPRRRRRSRDPRPGCRTCRAPSRSRSRSSSSPRPG